MDIDTYNSLLTWMLVALIILLGDLMNVILVEYCKIENFSAHMLSILVTVVILLFTQQYMKSLINKSKK